MGSRDRSALLFCLLAACSVYDPKLLTRDGSSDTGVVEAGDDASNGDDGGNGCVPSHQEFCTEICPETCNGMDDDCDGRADEESGEPLCTLANAASTCDSGGCLVVGCLNGASDCDGLPSNGCEARLDSPDHCGSCYAACNFPNASARCEEAICVFDACLPGFGDCDGDDANGCERTVNSLDNCGGCNVMCGAVANGQPGCIDLTCGVGECDTGFADCNEDPSDGCEVSLGEIGSCGGCNTVCSYDNATPLCAGGSCTPGACLDGFGDCDGDPLNDCEVTFATNINHCGACGRVCDSGGTSGSAYRCVAGECVVTTCPGGFGDCDGDASNGCETSLSTLNDCGSCGVSCSFPGARASCSDGTCAFVACQPGFGNCNATLNDGCETPLNSDSNCASCGDACDVVGGRMCSGGVCSLVSCPSGTADCDNDGVDCEQSLSTLLHCGVCNVRCGDAQGGLPNATASCAAGVCAIGSCGATFGNCDNDAVNGCETSLRSAANCGACGTACSRPNATSSCASGTCTTTACDVGFGDCDGDATNGCETNTNTSQNCGGCNTQCSRPNAVSSCASGTCSTLACNSGFGDCDGDASNGCETALNSLTHCGGCNVACALANASESCAAGSCALVTCDSGFGNCDFMAQNGCETPLNTAANCNACGALCDYANSSESCATGSCVLTGCSSGYANCDNNESNGCEQSLNTTAHCGGCNVVCSRNNASATCTTGSCALATCNSGFGNCDGEANNGCETTLGTASNCGACGDVCANDKPCENFVCRGSFAFATSNFDGNDSAIVPVGAATLNCGVSTFNSTTLAFGNWCGQPMPVPLVRTQGGGPDVVILAFDAFAISGGATLQLTGNRPVILAVYGDATIGGTVDASASGVTPGAGGNVSCAAGNGAPGDDGVIGSGTGGPGGGGGGGGAFGLASGAGGTTDDNQVSKGGVSRPAEGSAALVPLRGGCPGGRGGQGRDASTASGGAGGGAVQISAVGTLSVTGVVAAAGGRGINGGRGNGGGGGGSGGALLLEAANLTLSTTSWFSANGGGGAGGNPYTNDNGGDGADGGKTTTAQANGGSGDNSSGAGGRGGAQAGAAQNGANATGPYGSRGGGGGGGSVGRGMLRGVTSCALAQSTSLALSRGGVCP